MYFFFFFFFSSRRRHTRCSRDWSSDVCSSDLRLELLDGAADGPADAAFGGLCQAEIAIFQERPQAVAGPVGAVEPRHDDPGLELGHRFSPLRRPRPAGVFSSCKARAFGKRMDRTVLGLARVPVLSAASRIYPTCG